MKRREVMPSRIRSLNCFCFWGGFKPFSRAFQFLICLFGMLPSASAKPHSRNDTTAPLSPSYLNPSHWISTLSPKSTDDFTYGVWSFVVYYGDHPPHPPCRPASFLSFKAIRHSRRLTLDGDEGWPDGVGVGHVEDPEWISRRCIDHHTPPFIWFGLKKERMVAKAEMKKRSMWRHCCVCWSGRECSSR